MRKVIGIGETVLDIIFRDGQPIGAYPGGSTFNSVISLGRAGVETSFISETGNDRVGDKIVSFLKENGVNADNVNRYPDSKSPISLAFLNEHNNAEYLFYKDPTNDQFDFTYPDIQADDIVIFGSYYAVNPAIRPQVVGLLDYARSRGAIIYYDVNFRPAHKNEVMRITPNLLENLEYADIVRGSNEDFETLYKKDDPDKVYNSEISFYCKKFIHTQGARAVEVRAENALRKSYPVNSTETVSTIGAGDNFNAGFIYGMLRLGITHEKIEQGLGEEQWDGLVHYGQLFAGECCKSLYNYVSREFGERMKTELNLSRK
ncbi:carbohydrate kinase [Prevotella sp. KH2C16]|uniref:carbohydrate kinase family protein n=1 Tax=Prevotella sp. KH2C16 TaxID=1855325 RepID=UPI0008F0109A|nr:carbohydrate kinase [Prevotella sp. KH2C16]SFF82256.1 fructokinase [Prevotella sp. KH2C16]